MAKAKKLSKKQEKEVVDAINDTLDSMKVTQSERDDFKRDIDTICYKFSLEFPFWGVLSERCSFSLTKCLVPTAGITKVFFLDPILVKVFSWRLFVE